MSDKNKLSNNDMKRVSGGTDDVSKTDSLKTNTSEFQGAQIKNCPGIGHMLLSYGGPGMFKPNRNIDKTRQKILNENEENKISGGKIEVSDRPIEHMVCMYGGPGPSAWEYSTNCCEYGGPSFYSRRHVDRNHDTLQSQVGKSNDSTDDPLKK